QQEKRDGAQGERVRPALEQQDRDVLSRRLQPVTEVEVDRTPYIMNDLLPLRLVEAVLDVQVVDDGRGQLPALPVPGPTWRLVHEEEGDNDDEKEDGDHPEQAPDDVDGQGGRPPLRCPRDEGQDAPPKRGACCYCQFPKRKCTSKSGRRRRPPSRRRAGGSGRPGPWTTSGRTSRSGR